MAHPQPAAAFLVVLSLDLYGVVPAEKTIFLGLLYEGLQAEQL